MFKFIMRKYLSGRITFDEIKRLLIYHELTSKVNVVQNVESLEIKFTYQDYVLQKGEKFLEETDFFTK